MSVIEFFVFLYVEFSHNSSDIDSMSFLRNDDDRCLICAVVKDCT